MASEVSPIPVGYHSLTAYFIIQGAAKAIEFYKKAFGAHELFRIAGHDANSIGHAEIKIGDSVLMLADQPPGDAHKSPLALGGTPVSLLLYVRDVDTVFKRAIEAGAKQIAPVEDKFYGDRMGTLVDPFGHQWSIGTHIEDVSPEEMCKRAAAEHKKMSQK